MERLPRGQPETCAMGRLPDKGDPDIPQGHTQHKLWLHSSPRSWKTTASRYRSAEAKGVLVKSSTRSLGSWPSAAGQGFQRVPSLTQKPSETCVLKQKKETETREDTGSRNRRSHPGKRQRGWPEDGQRGFPEAAGQRHPRSRREGSEKVSHQHASRGSGSRQCVGFTVIRSEKPQRMGKQDNQHKDAGTERAVLAGCMAAL